MSQEGKGEEEMEGQGKGGKERRRERIRDGMEWCIGKEERIVKEKVRALNLLLGRKQFYRALQSILIML